MAVSQNSPARCRIDRLETEGAALVQAALEATGVADARTRAAWVVSGYTWYLAEPVATAWFGGRILDLSPDRITIGVGTDGAHDLDFEGPATPVGDPEAGRALLRRRLEQNLTVVLSLPALDAIGARARWLLAADGIAGALLHVGHEVAGTEAAVREAAALCAIPGPLHVPLDLIPGSDEEHGHPMRWRSSCCLAHRVGHELCSTCPRARTR